MSVHEFSLPDGRGMSPLSWQILDGVDNVVVSLIEATEKVDSGDIYFQSSLKLLGTELNAEFRELQAETGFELFDKWLREYPNVGCIKSKQREGKPSDTELDINKSIRDQFNLLRVVHNEEYPAFINYKGQKYVLKIHRVN